MAFRYRGLTYGKAASFHVRLWARLRDGVKHPTSPMISCATFGYYVTILQRQPLPIHATPIPNLDIVPSHILLSNTDVELTTARDHREACLKRELDQIKGRYDFVFIDCPPTLSWLTLNAFGAGVKGKDILFVERRERLWNRTP